MVGWLQPDGIHIDLAFRYTLEHLRAPKTPWNIPPKTTPDAPLHSQRWIRHKRTPTDTLRQSWGMSEGCLGVFEDAWQVQSMRNLVWLEPTHHFGTTLKWGIFFTWRLQDIKTSLCARTKNGSVMPLFVIFRPVRKKLQLTVSFDHPVLSKI